MAGRDKNFDGSYDKSRYASDDVEGDLKTLIEKGLIVGETSDGGLYKQNVNPGQERIDVWGKGEPGNYDHAWYENKDNYGVAPKDRFNK